MKPLFTALTAFALIPLAQAAEVKVGFSDEFTEDLTEDYGEREGEFLTKRIIEDLERALDKKGVDVARIDVTILDAKPNRPTFEQLSARPGLSFQSISIGGMSLEATAFDEEGNKLASKEYSWYENNLRDVIGSSTWSDARRTSRRFANRFAETLSE